MDELPEQDWRYRAACLNTVSNADDDFWFSTRSSDTKKAKSICAKCDVKRECIEDALEHESRFGIFGGATQYELRRAMQIGADGYPSTAVKPIRCPLCHCTRVLTIAKRRSWMRVTCADCGLSWVAKRVVPRKDTDKPSEEAEPPEAPES